MADLESLLYRLYADSATRTVSLFVVAMALGVGSVLVYVLSPGSEVGRVELVLQLAAALVLFYVALTNAD